jgi:DNA-nicking Smr family endonuclease
MGAEPIVRVPVEGSLDLHAFSPRDVRSVVEEYLSEAHAAGFREVRLVHGRGRGVQRGLVQAVLDHHPLVEEFWDAADSHLGATVARLVPGAPRPAGAASG